MTKDRMYCDAPDSPRRRATQFAMRQVHTALCRWLAPILCFTAEEAWTYTGAAGSVHLGQFPKDLGEWRNRDAHNRMSQAIDLRNSVMKEIEKARQKKLIGNSLEAEVVLCGPTDGLIFSWAGFERELEEIFIVSSVRLAEAVELRVEVAKTPYQKCARCWRHRPTVGASKTHLDLCDRCESAVSAR
jgi:isoleucyl-tRNA synthetase